MFQTHWRKSFKAFSPITQGQRSAPERRRRDLLLEPLEERCLLTAFTLVQNLGYLTDNGSGQPLSFPAKLGVAAGHSVFVEIAANVTTTTGDTPVEVTDTAGNSYQEVVASQNGTLVTALFTAHNVAAIAPGGMISVTFLNSAAVSQEAVAAQDFYGLVSNPVDFASSGAGSFGNSLSVRMGTNHDNDVVFAVFGAQVINDLLRPDAGAIVVPNVSSGSFTDFGASVYAEYETGLAATDTTFGPTLSISGNLLVDSLFFSSGPIPWAGAGAAYVTDPATHFQISASPSSVPGGALAVTVTALDQANAIDPDYHGAVHFISSDSAAGLPSDYTFVLGDRGQH